MKKKLINPKKYEAECVTCSFGRISPDGQNVLCPKKGIKGLSEKCRAYKYDPIKRMPKKAPVLETADPADFEL